MDRLLERDPGERTLSYRSGFTREEIDAAAQRNSFIFDSGNLAGATKATEIVLASLSLFAFPIIGIILGGLIAIVTQLVFLVPVGGVVGLGLAIRMLILVALRPGHTGQTYVSVDRLQTDRGPSTACLRIARSPDERGRIIDLTPPGVQRIDHVNLFITPGMTAAKRRAILNLTRASGHQITASWHIDEAEILLIYALRRVIERTVGLDESALEVQVVDAELVVAP